MLLCGWLTWYAISRLCRKLCPYLGDEMGDLEVSGRLCVSLLLTPTDQTFCFFSVHDFVGVNLLQAERIRTQRGRDPPRKQLFYFTFREASADRRRPSNLRSIPGVHHLKLNFQLDFELSPTFRSGYLSTAPPPSTLFGQAPHSSKLLCFILSLS